MKTKVKRRSDRVKAISMANDLYRYYDHTYDDLHFVAETLMVNMLELCRGKSFKFADLDLVADSFTEAKLVSLCKDPRVLVKAPWKNDVGSDVWLDFADYIPSVQAKALKEVRDKLVKEIDIS